MLLPAGPTTPSGRLAGHSNSFANREVRADDLLRHPVDVHAVTESIAAITRCSRGMHERW